MGFGFRVPGFGFSRAWIGDLYPRILRSAWGKIPRFARDDNSRGSNAVGSKVVAEQFATIQPETRDSKPETFFDTDFLRKLERLHLVAKRLRWAGAKGEHAASRKGFSLEFSDYRRYQHGDDLRYVDWNIYRRLDRLLLKVFTAEEEMNIYLLVDTSRSMAEGSPAKVDYARKVAAALGYIGLKNLDRVGGASFSTHLHTPLTLGRGRRQILSLFNFLSRLSCHGETNLRAATHAFTHLFPHPGFVVIVSDLFDPAGWRGAWNTRASPASSTPPRHCPSWPRGVHSAIPKAPTRGGSACARAEIPPAPGRRSRPSRRAGWGRRRRTPSRRPRGW